MAALRLIDLGVKNLPAKEQNLPSLKNGTDPAAQTPRNNSEIAAESAPYIVSTFPWLGLDFIISQQVYLSCSFAMFIIQREHSD